MKLEKFLPDLSRTELDILKVLWSTGKLTVREVQDQLHETYDWAYTTTKTIMDRMVKKDLLQRENFHGIFLYRAKISRPAGLARLVQFFADRVLELDYGSVVSLFARIKVLSPNEIKELENLLEQHKMEKI